jgi:AcrR family transcriptional regulator
MSSGAKPVDQRVARGDATREQILAAAREVLAAHGYRGASMRAVAERAGVQLSLVHYHFGGKRGLLAAVLEYENERLLERQQDLFAKPEPLAEKWRTACAYLQEDLRSGYVRILWELWTAGLTDEDLARRWRDAMGEWRALLERVVQEWAAGEGVALPMRPVALATLVANTFQGAEVEILAGVPEDDAPHFEALEAVAELIARLEAGAQSKESSTGKSARPSRHRAAKIAAPRPPVQRE